jgi:uncharacterized protein (DUF2384 family)
MPQGNQTKEARMERTLETWLAMPLATFEEIAAASGVSDKTFYRYRQDASFMAEYSRRQKQRFAALEGKAIALLEEQMENRNWNAIKYTLDGTGYKPTDKVEVQQTTISVSIDEEDE